jgi:thiol-disulfide isomerase/thioredoxin
MKLLAGLLALCLCVCATAAQELDVEGQVRQAVQSEDVTIVHLWAPWCPNCKAELTETGWKAFAHTNPEVNIIFVTVWAGDKGDGHEMLEKAGLTEEPNFKLLLHPNTSRKKADKMTEFLGLPVTWIPTTWVFRGGTLRYALNYGELRFPILQQLVRDAADKWER